VYRVFCGVTTLLRRFRPFEASRVFTFKDPDSGRTFTEKSMLELTKAVTSYRKQNRYEEIEQLSLVIENYLCGLPENFHKCQAVELHRSFMGYVKGGIHLIKNLAFKRFCSPEEAEKRAAQCVKCPLNFFPDKTGFLKWSDAVAIREVGQRKTSVHDKLGSCAGCGCPLKSKVFCEGPLKAFTAEEVAKMKPVKCWQLKLSGQE